MIVGTAGHIDHGKTTLVRALTGVDTDRLKEEKERGISIELGYAYSPLADGAMLGFVDVPGHERLIHTMVAGATGIDFALLVVAADDGVMPQTREHLAILDVLGLACGAVALTKIDRVDETRIAEVETEVETLLEGSALDGAPIFGLDATRADSAGVKLLREYLHAAAIEQRERSDAGLFRLAIDRVFTLAGHGTVVTGTVYSGSIRIGDTISVMPRNLVARVRGIHTNSRPADIGNAGQRCAINLAGVEKADLVRGDWLADARALTPTQHIDADLVLFADAQPLRQWSLVHIHFGTTHHTPRVVLLDVERLAPSGRGRVQFVFDTPVCATSGDRFIVRDAQAAHTIGGGVLLDPFAPARKRRSPERLRRLDALARMIAGEGPGPLLAEAQHGIAESELVQLAGREIEETSLPADTRVIATSSGHLVIDAAHWQNLRQRVLAALRDFHARVPDETGPDVGRLRRIAAPEVDAHIWLALVDDLVRDSSLARTGPWLHLSDHVVTLSADERVLAEKVLPLLTQGGFDPPWTRDLARSVQVSEEAMRRALRKLAAEGAVLQVVPDLFYAPEIVAQLSELAAEVARPMGRIEVTQFRDRIGIGRKRAIQILEFFDRVGYTRRQRDARVLRVDSGWRVAVEGTREVPPTSYPAPHAGEEE